MNADVVQIALSSAAFHMSWAPFAAFVAGAVTSMGPCVAPRIVAVVALAGESSGRTRWMRVSAFITGIAGSSLAAALSVSMFLQVERSAAITYWLIASALAIFGLRTLSSSHGESCARVKTTPASIGACFLLGASLGLIVSPCCTPIFVALAALRGVAIGPYTIAILLAFALGHAVPLLLAALGGTRAASLMREQRVRGAVNVVSGALMIALAAYYAVLA